MDGETGWQAGRQGAEDFRISADERTLTGALWLPRSAAVAAPLVFCGHGASVIDLCGASGAASGIAGRLLGDARAIEHPVLFLMQLEDELFDRAGCLDLFDAFASKDKRMHANPGLHPEVPAEEIDFALGFLAARLQGAVPRRIGNPLAE